ncbi:MFS transporter [Rhizobium lentis]|uniref:MFS transporter n=1 Tax=Rhizobium lentis TaxID=1138194 RepID=UPI001A938749|nr:MFS transporter [Rhizobium lentis]MBX4998268.1 MFS transporter [Rhizobium lentis]MBX5016606.1 MFS transporter [Rhizobium lentis]MBX5043436.1 MFS transporter [Rhizobium lentis]MBX5056242.1 MFS transporter [Rhizobium lentis]MBX5066412.1 MFS transporter [Rhizobium lentis]
MVAAAESTENTPPPSLGFHALTLATFFGASSVPTPLYRIYQENFAISPVLITVIFAVYAFALLAALLTAGSISDHLGRRPVIFTALLLEIVAMVLFVAAGGPGWLIAARIVQGVATGIAGASLGAALVDVDRAKGQIVNSIAPLSGMAVGAIGTSALIQYGPFPMHLIYALLLVAFALQAAAIWLTRETGSTRPGALGSLVPRVSIPPEAKRPLSLVTPINIANWTLGGFYLSLVPSLVASTTGSTAPLTGGAVVAALTASGATAVYVRRSKTAAANLLFGVSVQTLGILTVVAGVHLANVPLLLIGTIFTGAGFGTNFLGSIGTIMPLAKADERAGLLSAFYIQSYLAFSLPAILAGFLAKSAGYRVTTDIYASAILLLLGVGIVALRTGRREAAESAA